MPIRPLALEDLGAVASLYAELDKRDPARPAPGYVDFFRRALLEPPLADPEIPSLVHEDERDGVVAVIGSHVRPFLHGERRLRLACSGPLIVHPRHRPRGIGALLLRRYASGAQDATFNDRSIDDVHTMWRLLGADTDATASIGWRRVLAPAGAVLETVTRRLPGRRKPAAVAVAATRIDTVAGRGPESSAPALGTAEELSERGRAELLARLGREFVVRPAYDEDFRAALMGLARETVLGTRLVSRLVRDGDGRALGAFVAIVAPRGPAHVLELWSAYEDAGAILDHIFHEAARAGAVEVGGRVQPQLLPHLGARRCRLQRADWVTVRCADPELARALLSGRALVSRLDGEWWMRPRATLA